MTTLRRNSNSAMKARTAPQLIPCSSFIPGGLPRSEFARDGEAEAVFFPVGVTEELVIILDGQSPVNGPVDVAGVEQREAQEARRRFPTAAQRPAKLLLVLGGEEECGVRRSGGPRGIGARVTEQRKFLREQRRNLR